MYALSFSISAFRSIIELSSCEIFKFSLNIFLFKSISVIDLTFNPSIIAFSSSLSVLTEAAIPNSILYDLTSSLSSNASSINLPNNFSGLFAIFKYAYPPPRANNIIASITIKIIKPFFFDFFSKSFSSILISSFFILYIIS